MFTQTRKPAYLVKWYISGGSYTPAITVRIHDKAVSGLKLSSDSDKLIVSTSDGFVKLVSPSNLKVQFEKRLHKMVVTCAMIDSSEGILVTGSNDYAYNILSASTFNPKAIVGRIFFQVFLMVLTLFYISEYLV